jgi:hypothetical protein
MIRSAQAARNHRKGIDTAAVAVVAAAPVFVVMVAAADMGCPDGTTWCTSAQATRRLSVGGG